MIEAKPYHYWAINKRVIIRLWNDLSHRQREIVSNDVEQSTPTFKEFTRQVSEETERMFQDAELKFNQAHTFKLRYRQ